MLFFILSSMRSGAMNDLRIISQALAEISSAIALTLVLSEDCSVLAARQHYVDEIFRESREGE